MAAGPDFVINDATVINLHGGFKYTNMKWKAYGGSYIYSGDGFGFREDRGKFPDGEPVIDYEQRYFGLFLGAKATTTLGNLTLSGLLRSGFTVDASAVDHHWLREEGRGLRFEDDFFTVPFISAGAKIDYQMTDRASVFLAGNVDKYFRNKGYKTAYSIATGEQGAHKDSAGMDFYALTLSAGFKLTF